ncbi:MAG: hypothetical protein A3F18_00935 [Legionellales bacterium RIFCSPHIGHO2_12_FULL_37_14]|nr:MAG: hypothetical protein A3F18_00935 [Legionellales bacterium RIFCSPHIGHO2_12_FULL_37_14]
MLKFNLNSMTQKLQTRTLIKLFIVLILVSALIITLSLSNKKPVKQKEVKEEAIQSVIDESFSKADTESALLEQQTEVEQLKNQITLLTTNIDKLSKDNQHEIFILKKQITELEEKPKELTTPKPQTPLPKINALAFNYHKKSKFTKLNPMHYVPSGTFVRAVILGGADADASVNGQSKNNGVMLFKLLSQGTLPNGKHSRLKGCFVTASSYGDISSERAYVILEKLACANKNEPIIDKSVTGWAFFGGKVGIKGMPLMRDNKVMQWAGISGALSGIASAAQQAQQVQNLTPLGASSIIPAARTAPFAAYGGASKAAEVLSSYYVKRAEQYHPVIQVGAGNFVTVVFKDGFYLEPDSKEKISMEKQNDGSNFEVPPEVLKKIEG